MPARSLAIGPAVCEQPKYIRATAGLLSAIYVKRLNADRFKARFMRQRLDASLFSSFLHFCLYDIWLIGLHRSIGV